jgi:carboxypeptidase Taq
MMPSGGVEFRSRQLSQLARLSHEHSTDERIGELLEEAADEHTDEDSPESANIREMRRDYDMATKIPADLIESIAKLSSIAQHEWVHARKNNDFNHFKPHLEKMIELSRRKADCLGVPEGGELWDALADTFEPGMCAREIATIFEPIRDRLSGLVADLMSSSTRPSNAFNDAVIPIPDQERFTRMVAEKFGFDFNRGRLDTSVHPFCGGSHCNDVRMTSRFLDTNVNDALGGVMHETGHGLYEQGLPYEHVGTPLGDSISLGIHESQSRMWENQVGRSPQFWEWCAPIAKETLGDQVAGLTVEDIYGGANIVRPGFIRVDADEATYNLHVMVRFELERALISGDLDAADIPGEWNRMYKDYLGLEVTEDRLGCLQDVHWSMGAIGYFPTYTLGNLYCAQFFESACAAMPGLVDGFATGTFEPLLEWLRTNIHSHGRRYRAADLCERITGKPLSAEPLMNYLEGKLRPLYGV